MRRVEKTVAAFPRTAEKQQALRQGNRLGRQSARASRQHLTGMTDPINGQHHTAVLRCSGDHVEILLIRRQLTKAAVVGRQALLMAADGVTLSQPGKPTIKAAEQ